MDQKEERGGRRREREEVSLLSSSLSPGYSSHVMYPPHTPILLQALLQSGGVYICRPYVCLSMQALTHVGDNTTREHPYNKLYFPAHAGEAGGGGRKNFCTCIVSRVLDTFSPFSPFLLLLCSDNVQFVRKLGSKLFFSRSQKWNRGTIQWTYNPIERVFGAKRGIIKECVLSSRWHSSTPPGPPPSQIMAGGIFRFRVGSRRRTAFLRCFLLKSDPPTLWSSLTAPV